MGPVDDEYAAQIAIWWTSATGTPLGIMLSIKSSLGDVMSEVNENVAN